MILHSQPFLNDIYNNNTTIVGMIGADSFGLADKRLRTGHLCDSEWFGGANIILFGHHAQVLAVSHFSFPVTFVHLRLTIFFPTFYLLVAACQ